MHLKVILNSSQNYQHLFVWKYLCKPSSSLSPSSSSSSYSSSNLTEAQIDPNPFHSLMSAIGLRRKLCKRNSEQVIDSYHSPNKSEITIKISVWNTFHRISRILFCFIQRQLHKSTEISLALIFLISKLFGLLSGMKLKEFFLLQNSRGKRKTLKLLVKGSFDFCCRFGLSVLARNEPEAPIKRQRRTQFFFYIYTPRIKLNSFFPHSKYKIYSLFHSK